MNSDDLAGWIKTSALFALFFAILFSFPLLERLLPSFFLRRGIMMERVPLWLTAWQHIYLVAASSSLSIIVGLLLGVVVFFPFAREFRELFIDLSSLGETFPSVAIIALTVPVLGYGFWPVLVALFIYGILPVLRNTITGIANVDPGVTDSARGMGMSTVGILREVSLPLALPVIVAGVRTSVIINIGAAAIGATVGAGGFGIPIISGIRSNDLALVLRGSIPVALLAIAVDSLFAQLERAAARRI
ncbi:MAG: ABC transporter permease [Clostridia bacterium]